MGELLTQLRKDNMQAMKDKDTLKKGVLSLVISAIALAEKENKVVLEKNDELKFIQKELKQTKETLESIPADRMQTIAETKQKIAILEQYLPTQLTSEQIQQIIETFMRENQLEALKKNQGQIMKHVLGEYKGQVDGKLVNQVLATILK